MTNALVRTSSPPFTHAESEPDAKPYAVQFGACSLGSVILSHARGQMRKRKWAPGWFGRGLVICWCDKRQILGARVSPQ